MAQSETFISAENIFKGAEMIEAEDPDIDLNEVIFFDSESETNDNDLRSSESILDIQIRNIKEEKELIIEDNSPINNFSDENQSEDETIENHSQLRINSIYNLPAYENKESPGDLDSKEHMANLNLSLSDHLYAYSPSNKDHCLETIKDILKLAGISEANSKILDLMQYFTNAFQLYTEGNTRLDDHLNNFVEVISSLRSKYEKEHGVLRTSTFMTDKIRGSSEDLFSTQCEQEVDIKPQLNNDHESQTENFLVEIEKNAENSEENKLIVQCMQQVDSAVSTGQNFIDTLTDLKSSKVTNITDAITKRKKLNMAIKAARRDLRNLSKQIKSHETDFTKYKTTTDELSDASMHSASSDSDLSSSLSSISSRTRRKRRMKRERNSNDVTSTKTEINDNNEINPTPNENINNNKKDEARSRIEKLLDFTDLEYKQVSSKSNKTSATNKVVKEKKKTENGIGFDLDSSGDENDDDLSETSSNLSEKGTSDEEDEMLKRREEAIKEALLCDSSLSSDSSDSENIDDLLNSSSDDEKKPEEIKNEEEVQDEVQEVKQEMTIDKPEKAKLPRISDPNKQVEEEKISDDELEEKNLNLPSFKSIKKPTYRSADDKEIFSRSLFKGVGVTNSNTRPNTSISNEKNKTKQNNETKTVDMKTEEEHIPELGVDASMFKENYKKRKPSEVSERSTTSSTATTSTSFLNPKSLSPPKPAITPAISLDEDEEVISLSSDSDSEVNSVTTETGENGKVFPKRKKMLSEAELKEETKQAQKAEKERVERLKKKNEHMSELMTQRMSQSLSQEDDEEELILDFDKSDNPIAVHRNLVAKMKQHQKDGVKFMYDVSFGSLRDEVKTASGCILAHSMGLGKTLQLVSLVHTLIMHKVLETKRILIICPKSTILNWKDEFLKWLKNIPSNGLKIFYNADDKQIHERVKEIESWYDLGRPGVFLINYEAFRNMVNYPKVGKPAKTPMAPELIEKLQKTIKKCFVSPGPDLVVCDEGHYIKNEKGATRKAVGQIETRRRIILTGTPLQNNLCEYYAMVNWIKPGILGTMKEFNNLYANPIKDGQHNDSTPGMIKRMKQRSLILNNKLSNFVQRKEASVLKEFLPEKHEYVIFVPLTSVQEKLYKHFLASCDGEKGHSLMNDYTALRKIWTHPSALKNARDRAMAGELKVGEKTSKKNVDDDGEEEDVHDKIDGDMGVKSTWWQKFVTNDDLNSLTTSNKLILLFDILKMCEERKEKVLIFSSFVAVLNIVEEFMKKINECYNRFEPTETDLRYNFHQYKTRYEKNHDYIRLDGSTKRWDRQQMIARFNDESNTRLRCFLISAKAGGQGINLTSANRCIILDTSWNPSSDLQNIFRIYRLGQKKTCFAYRFIALGTMDEKVYSRSVTKQAMSGRVVDKRQIDRHFKLEELQKLYQYERADFSKRPQLQIPRDPIFTHLICKYQRNNLIYKYHSHDTLLEDKPEQGLTDAEIKEAWEVYQQEVNRTNVPVPTTIPNSTDLMISNVGSFPNLSNYSNYEMAGLLQLMNPLSSLANPYQSFIDYTALNSSLSSKTPTTSSSSSYNLFNNFTSLYPDPTKLLADLLRKNKDIPSTSKQTANDSRKRKPDDLKTTLKPGINSAAGLSILPDDFETPAKQRKLDEQTKSKKSTHSEVNEMILQHMNPGLTISPIQSSSKSASQKQKETHDSESARTRFPQIMNSRVVSGMRDVSENSTSRQMPILQPKPTSKHSPLNSKTAKSSIQPPLNISSKTNPFIVNYQQGSSNSNSIARAALKINSNSKDRSNILKTQPSLSVLPSSSANIATKSVITAAPNVLPRTHTKPVNVSPKKNNTPSTASISTSKQTTNNIQQRSVIMTTPKATVLNNSSRMSTLPKVVSNVFRPIGDSTKTSSSNGTSVQAMKINPISIPRNKVLQSVPRYVQIQDPLALATSISKKSSHSSPQQSSTSSSPVTSKLIYPSQQHQIRKSDSSKNS